MKLIVVAMEIEIKEIIKKIKVELFIKKPFIIYKYNKGYFCITGIGIQFAISGLTYCLTKLKDINKIYNFGYAGSIDKNLKILDIITIKKDLLFFDKLSFYLNINKNLNLKSYNLLTSNFFINKDINKLNFNNKFQLFNNLPFKISVVDMELGGYCYVAKKFNKKIYSVKIITDNIFMKKSSKEQYEIYCNKASLLLSDFFLNFFDY